MAALSELFASAVEFAESEFSFEELSMRVVCSKAAVTDFDLTGQVVWPSARVLGYYMHSLGSQGKLKQCHVLELGCGVGLAGLVAMRFADWVLMTDGVEEVVQLAERNIQLQQTLSKASGDKETKQQQTHLADSHATVLKWGAGEQSLQKLKEQYVKELEHLDVIIAADVIQWPNAVKPLIETVGQLFQWSKKPSLSFILAVCFRSQVIRSLFLEQVEAAQLKMQEIPLSSFIPESTLHTLLKQAPSSLHLFSLSVKV